MRAARQSENSVQQQVVTLLESYCRPDVTWFAVPNGEWRYRRTAARLKAQGVRAGAPDLIVLVDGHFHGIELKSEHGRPSDAQVMMGERIVLSGGDYHVCYGLHATVKKLIDIGVFTPSINFTFRDT